jgi:hypothetical protein
VSPAPGTSAAVLEHLVEGRLALPRQRSVGSGGGLQRGDRAPAAESRPTVLALVGRAEAYLALSRRDAAEVECHRCLRPGATAATEAPRQRG